jgi:hypothetical protein
MSSFTFFAPIIMHLPYNGIPNKINKKILKAGKYAFLFFLIKGIVWLAALLLLTWEIIV